jgi:hypothetical protein
MDAKQIEQYLQLVADELKAMKVKTPIQLLLVGGGYMVTQVQSRSMTDDVDTVWVHPEIDAGSELYRLFEVAIDLIADDEHLDEKWLNIDVGDFIRAAGPLPKITLWKKFGLIHVYLPPLDFILAHKIAAGRKKDGDDIAILSAQLKVKKRKDAQRILDTYISEEIQANNRVATKLALFFPN